MTLKESYFMFSGREFRFKVYSDRPTRSVLIQVIQEPIGNGLIELYQVEPSDGAQWVVVTEVKGWTQDPMSQCFKKCGDQFEKVTGVEEHWVRAQLHDHQRRHRFAA